MISFPEEEQALLGAALVDNSLALSLELEPDDFANEWHQQLWALAQALAGRGRSFTVGAVAAELPKLERYLVSLRDFAAAMPQDIAGHAKAVRDASARRQVKAVATEMGENAGNLEHPIDEIVADAVSDLSKLSDCALGEAKGTAAAHVAHGMVRAASCYPSGLPSLDRIIGGGFYAGKAYGIAARKKVGKTAFLGTVSHNLNQAVTPVPHLFVALEMSPEEIEQRNMAREFQCNSVEFIGRNRGKWLERAADYAATVGNHTFYEHAPGASLDDLRRMVLRAITQQRIKGVILDYWQLVSGKQRNETEEYHLRNVAQWVADVCRKHSIWALIAAQVNQEGNTRGGEGLKLATDCYFTLHREKGSEGAWLEMEESRYVPYADVGSESAPGLYLNAHGPYFQDAAEHAAPQGSLYQ